MNTKQELSQNFIYLLSKLANEFVTRLSRISQSNSDNCNSFEEGESEFKFWFCYKKSDKRITIHSYLTRLSQKSDISQEGLIATIIIWEKLLVGLISKLDFHDINLSKCLAASFLIVTKFYSDERKILALYTKILGYIPCTLMHMERLVFEKMLNFKVNIEIEEFDSVKRRLEILNEE